jgi:hypothetical protein
MNALTTERRCEVWRRKVGEWRAIFQKQQLAQNEFSSRVRRRLSLLIVMSVCNGWMTIECNRSYDDSSSFECVAEQEDVECARKQQKKTETKKKTKNVTSSK